MPIPVIEISWINENGKVGPATLLVYIINRRITAPVE